MREIRTSSLMSGEGNGTIGQASATAPFLASTPAPLETCGSDDRLARESFSFDSRWRAI
jgi:hypothetical protein